MQLSIVTTLYQSAPYLDEFLERMSSSAQQITNDYEIILVNDGSPDHSLQKALAAQAQDAHLKIIELSRNFGHHEAGMVGLEAAQGDYVFLIDSDLEEAPELILAFWQDMVDHPDLDVVYGVQKDRKGNWFERLSGYFFYTVLNYISEIQIPANLLTVRLMKKIFVDAVLQYPEKNLFLAGLMALAGFNQRAVSVNKLSKKNSTYTLSKQLKLLITCITAISTKPLEYIFIVGLILTSLSFLAAVFYGIKYLFMLDQLLDQLLASGLLIILSTGFISGIIIMCTGILGVYLAKIYIEVKQRPRAIIKKIY